MKLSPSNQHESHIFQVVKHPCNDADFSGDGAGFRVRVGFQVVQILQLLESNVHQFSLLLHVFRLDVNGKRLKSI